MLITKLKLDKIFITLLISNKINILIVQNNLYVSKSNIYIPIEKGKEMNSQLTK